MMKRVTWISLDDRTDQRVEHGSSNGTILGILTGDVMGWGSRNTTVMAVPYFSRYGYAEPAHATLSDEERAQLPKFSTMRDFWEKIEGENSLV